MITSLFPKLEDVNLTEYADNSSFEEYSGIVLDPDDNLFKTVSGMFRDKKDFYEKLTARGYIVRKVFEKKVFDWIEKNAKTTLEAYLMFSTAFSKWKGNNLLDSYYVQLLNDIPQLNREKEKGDPNSMGKKSESVQKLAEEGKGYTLTVIPHYFKYENGTLQRDENGKPIEDLTLSDPLTFSHIQFNSNLIPADRKFSTKNQWNSFIRSGKTKDGENFLDRMKREVTPAELDNEGRSINGAENNPAFVISTENKAVTPTYFTFQINGETLKDVEGKPIQYSKAAITNSTNDIAKKITASSIAGRNTNDAIKKTQDTVQAALGQADWHEIVNNVRKDLASTLIHQQAADTINPKQVLNNAMDAIENNKLDSNAVKKARKILAANVPNKIFNVVNELSPVADYIRKDYETIKDLETERRKLNSGKDNARILEINNAIDEIYKKYKENPVARDTANKLMNADMFDIARLSNKDLQKIYLSGDPEAQERINALIDLQNQDNEIKSKPSRGNDDNRQIINDLGIKTGGSKSKLVKSKTESITNDEKIPVVDDPTQVKYVNYNASQSYANQPVDGVITNPGAIPTSGHYMYDSTEDDSLDWVSMHKELNQNLFEGSVLREDVRKAFLDIADKFKATLNLNMEPVDLYFTGSSANFNYTPTSDIDLHLVYDFEQIGINAEILTKYFIAKKQLFNSNYNITVKGLPVEMGVENLNEPIVSSAIYSVTKDKWLLEPEVAKKIAPKFDTDMFYKLVQKIEDAIETHDSVEIGKVWDEIYDIRKDSLAKEGELGKGNMIFKRLRNLGYLNRIKKAYYSNASDELSLESLREMEI